MKKIICVIVISVLMSCNEAPNQFVGHTYMVEPINSIQKMKLTMSLTNVVHEYKSNHDVLITTYIGREVSKKESMRYTFDGKVFVLENENYDIDFIGDTAYFLINGEKFLKLVPIN